MITDSKKLELIEQVLRVDDEAVLEEVSRLLNKHGSNQEIKPKLSDFIGVITDEDADIMRQAVADNRKIHPDDWK